MPRNSAKLSFEQERTIGIKVDDAFHLAVRTAHIRNQPLFLITDDGMHTLDVCTHFQEACRSQVFTKGARHIWRRGPTGGMEQLKIRVVA